MENQVLEKLPVDLSGIPESLDQDAVSRIEAINQEFSRLNGAIKDLELEKGIASRKIGEAKKAGEPFEEHINKTKQTANDIKSLKNEINTLREEVTTLLTSEKNQAPKLPGHFEATSENTEKLNINELSVRVATKADKDHWNQYANNHQNSHVYHQFGFHDIVVDSFQQSPIYLIAEDANKKIRGILPSTQLSSKIFGNYVVSVPYFNYGGALADSIEIRDMLMAALAKLSAEREATHIEFRNTCSISSLPEKKEKCSLLLELPSSPDELKSQLAAKVRSQIKKSQSYGLTAKTGKLDLLDDFYQVFAINMRDLGTPVYSKSFFRNILETEDLNTKLVVAYDQGKPISCAFLITYKDTMEIPWASTLKSANNKNANMFLYWEVLTSAINAGVRFFDFGRSSKDAGTFKFKKQWGAKEYQLFWQYSLFDSQELPELNPNNPKYQLAIAIWKKLPVWVTKIIGPFLVKNLP